MIQNNTMAASFIHRTNLVKKEKESGEAANGYWQASDNIAISWLLTHILHPTFGLYLGLFILFISFKVSHLVKIFWLSFSSRHQTSDMAVWAFLNQYRFFEFKVVPFHSSPSMTSFLFCDTYCGEKEKMGHTFIFHQTWVFRGSKKEPSQSR